MHINRIVEYLRFQYPITYHLASISYHCINLCLVILLLPMRLLPLKTNKIVICSFFGKGYTDNPKYIAQELLSRHPEYDIVWILRPDNQDKAEIPNMIRVISWGSIKSFYELMTAKVWVDNQRKLLSCLRKRKGQIYIQTWHGFGPKNIQTEYVNLNYFQLKGICRDSNNTDLYLSNNSILDGIYRRSFFYNGEILRKGFPRNDVLFVGDREKILTKIQNKYNISASTKIIMYAPTYRNGYGLEIYNLDYSRCLDALTEKFGDNWCMLLRLHPTISYKSKDIGWSDSHIIDVSDYLDMQELLLISDVLITDYSSCMFDYFLTKKPCFIYAPDYEIYQEKVGFCLDMNELPFTISKDTDELINNINHFEHEPYINLYNHYNDKYGFTDDGNASKAVVDWIEQKLNITTNR